MDMNTGKIAELAELEAAGAEDIEELTPAERRVLEQVQPEHRPALLKEIRAKGLLNSAGRKVRATLSGDDAPSLMTTEAKLVANYHHEVERRRASNLRLKRRNEAARKAKRKDREKVKAARKARRANR